MVGLTCEIKQKRIFLIAVIKIKFLELTKFSIYEIPEFQISTFMIFRIVRANCYGLGWIRLPKKKNHYCYLSRKYNPELIHQHPSTKKDVRL